MKWFTIPIRLTAVVVTVLLAPSAYPTDKSIPAPASSQSSQPTWNSLASPQDTMFTFLDHSQLVNMKLFHAYGKAGIDFAFPTQTLYLAGDSNRKLDIHVAGHSSGD